MARSIGEVAHPIVRITRQPGRRFGPRQNEERLESGPAVCPSAPRSAERDSSPWACAPPPSAEPSAHVDGPFLALFAPLVPGLVGTGAWSNAVRNGVAVLCIDRFPQQHPRSPHTLALERWFTDGSLLPICLFQLHPLHLQDGKNPLFITNIAEEYHSPFQPSVCIASWRSRSLNSKQ
jgi:hypothetical protein